MLYRLLLSVFLLVVILQQDESRRGTVGRTWKSHCVQVVMAQHFAFMWRGKICLLSGYLNLQGGERKGKKGVKTNLTTHIPRYWPQAHGKGESEHVNRQHGYHTTHRKPRIPHHYLPLRWDLMHKVRQDQHTDSAEG